MYITPCGNEQVGEKGGVEAVLEAGVSHLSNAVVAEESCGCLHALVWGAQNKVIRFRLGGSSLNTPLAPPEPMMANVLLVSARACVGRPEQGG